MFTACLLVLVGALVVVALSILIEGRTLAVMAWALLAVGLIAVVLSWGSLTARSFPSSRFASYGRSVEPESTVSRQIDARGSTLVSRGNTLAPDHA